MGGTISLLSEYFKDDSKSHWLVVALIILANLILRVEGPGRLLCTVDALAYAGGIQVTSREDRQPCDYTKRSRFTPHFMRLDLTLVISLRLGTKFALTSRRNSLREMRRIEKCNLHLHGQSSSNTPS